MSGGAALIAVTSIAGQLALPIGAAVLGIGGAAGGNMVAQNMCLGKYIFLKKCMIIHTFHSSLQVHCTAEQLVVSAASLY